MSLLMRRSTRTYTTSWLSKSAFASMQCDCYSQQRPGWSGGAMVLGKLAVPGRPTILITVGQGPIALAIGAGGVVWTFLLSSILSPLSPFLWETA